MELPGLRLSKKSVFNHASIEYVGALIERPAMKCCEFADISGEFVRYYRRAVTDRPYSVIAKCAFFYTL